MFSSTSLSSPNFSLLVIRCELVILEAGNP